LLPGSAPALIVVVLLAVTGCATRWHYEKATADEAATERDRDECAREARVPFGSHPIELSEGRIWSFPFQTVDPKVLNDCMEKKGYTLLP